MNATVTPKNVSKFEPSTITIELESMDDVIKMYCLFNHADVSDGLDITNLSEHIRKSLRDVYGDINSHDMFDHLCNVIIERN